METFIKDLIYTIYWKLRLFAHWIRMRKFLKEHPDYSLIHSKEANEKLIECINNTNVRLKIIACLTALPYTSEIEKKFEEYEVKEEEMERILNLSVEILRELKIV